MNKSKSKIAVVSGLVIVMILSAASSAFGAQVIGKSKAVQIATSNASASKSAVRLSCEYERDDCEYEVEFKKGAREYSYKIDAITGRILEKNIEWRYVPSSKAKIGKNNAKKKALNFTGLKSSQVKNMYCYYDYDDGKALYVVEFTRGNYYYEIEINARSGKMHEYNREYMTIY